MRTFFRLLLASIVLLGASQGRAQQRPAAATDSATAAPARLAPGTFDVIVHTNGDELPAQVLRITPEAVRYLPLPLPTDLRGQAATPDTLQLAATDVLMVRYADGTEKPVRPAEDSASTALPSLVGLSRVQRYERGRQDSRQHYEPAKGVFWGTFASTAAAGPAGLLVGTAVAATRPARAKLNAPNPALLNDPAYYKGYQRQAKTEKLGKAALGFGAGAMTATVIYAVLITVIFDSMLGGGTLLHLY